ncbi:serine/threonine protein kinase, partial [Myxococcota bacterium]|nr:serine/threonine protein kinase [Myxococcota bacterium]
MASEALRPFGAYVLLRALGRGAMGDVHLARPYNAHRGIPTPVVIKRLLGELAHKKGFIARFRHEASVAVSVDSPNVAKVYDVGSVGDALYIVMEYVAGWPMSSVLEAIMKSGRHASVPSVLDAIIGALDGLHAIHTAIDQTTGKPLGIVHRDISPKNLIVGEDGRVRVIDLGLGKSNAQDWKTRTGVVMGSVGYMPPEQAAGEHVDVRADVYAIAAVAYEMLALRNYIKRGPLTDMMAESMSPRFRPPSQVRPDVPPDLDAILEKALRPKKEDRFADAAELRDALARLARPGDLQGQLAELVDDLFGATKHERERDLDALLALPLPVDESEEHEATQVFVQRAGVAPDSIAPDDQRADRTRQVPAKALTRDRIVRPRPRDPDATEPPIPRDHVGSKELLRRSPASVGADAT